MDASVSVRQSRDSLLTKPGRAYQKQLQRSSDCLEHRERCFSGKDHREVVRFICPREIRTSGSSAARLAAILAGESPANRGVLQFSGQTTVMKHIRHSVARAKCRAAVAWVY
jgi:hypothetical protein